MGPFGYDGPKTQFDDRAFSEHDDDLQILEKPRAADQSEVATRTQQVSKSASQQVSKSADSTTGLIITKEDGSLAEVDATVNNYPGNLRFE